MMMTLPTMRTVRGIMVDGIVDGTARVGAGRGGKGLMMVYVPVAIMRFAVVLRMYGVWGNANGSFRLGFVEAGMVWAMATMHGASDE